MFHERVITFIEQSVKQAVDGLTVIEFFSIVSNLIEVAVYTAEQFTDLSGPEKKERVMRSVAVLLDKLVPLLPLPWYVAWAWLFIEPIVKHFAYVSADQTVELVVERMKTVEG